MTFRMDLTKWFTVTTLCALMLMFDGLLHDVDCDVIYLVDLRLMVLLFVINIRNCVCSLAINMHASRYIEVAISCVKHLFLQKTVILWGALLCVLILWLIYVTRGVMLLLDDHIVHPIHQPRSVKFENEKTFVTDPDVLPSRFTVTWNVLDGEDMEMICEHMDDKVAWLFNGEPLSESSRLHSFLRKNTRSGIQVLRLHSVTHEDLGTYSFVVSYPNRTAIELVRKGVLQLRNEFVLYSILCEYILLEDVPRSDKVMVPYGGIFGATFTFASFADDDCMYVDRTVNGQPMDLVCDPSESCSLLLYLYKRYYLRETVGTGVTYYEHVADDAYYKQKIVLTNYQMCMCPKAFGKHSVSYFRRVFNREKGIFELIEIQDAEYFIVEPSRSPFLNWMIDVLGWAQPAAGNTTMNEQAIQEVSLYSKAIEYCVCIFLAVLYIITGCLTIWYFMIFIFFIRLVLYIVHMRLKKARKTRTFNHTRTFIQTRIYILCCEEDTRWSEVNIRPIIKTVGHTSYIHHIDTHPGQTELEGIRTGMRMCQTFVIVVSVCAMEDPMWRYQVDIILYRLARRDVPAFNVLVVTLDGAWYPATEDVIPVRNVTTIDWEEGNRQEPYVQFRNEDLLSWLFACDPHVYLANC